MLPSIRQECKYLEKENRLDLSRSIHHKKGRPQLHEPSEKRLKKVDSFESFSFKLNRIIKKIKT